MNISLRGIVSLFLSLALWGVSVGSSAQEQVTYYHNDALGSPIVATNADGTVKWREAYTPSGSRLRYESRETTCAVDGLCYPVDALGDEKQWYTSQFEETSVGLLYYGARWYEPEIGRFLTEDPVEFHEENVFSFNRYAYANNNPYRYTDPDGQSPVDVIFLSIDVGRLAVAIYTGDQAGAQSAAVDVAFSAVGVLVPIPGAGQALKAVNAADRVVDIAHATSATKSAVRSAEGVAKSGDNVADFVVTKGGTAVPVSQSQMRKGFDEAGFPSSTSKITDETAITHTVPTSKGPVDVRTMEGGANHPRRAVFSTPGQPRSPRTPDGGTPRGTKLEQRAASHLEQSP